MLVTVSLKHLERQGPSRFCKPFTKRVVCCCPEGNLRCQTMDQAVRTLWHSKVISDWPSVGTLANTTPTEMPSPFLEKRINIDIYM